MYSGFLGKWTAPIEINCGVTLPPKNATAFLINRPVGLAVKTNFIQTETETSVVIRAFIPYDTFNSFVDYDLGIRILSIYQNDMLKELAKHRTDISDAFFKRPELNFYFNELDGYAGYEIGLRCPEKK